MPISVPAKADDHSAAAVDVVSFRCKPLSTQTFDGEEENVFGFNTLLSWIGASLHQSYMD
jgi:hypothetical protein